MAKHLVICVDCGDQFDANKGGNYDPIVRRYTCPKCYKLALEVAKQMELRRLDAETKAMYEELKKQPRVKTSPEIHDEPRKNVAVEIIVWALVALSVCCLAAEFAVIFSVPLPVVMPFYVPMIACVLLGAGAFALAGKL